METQESELTILTELMPNSPLAVLERGALTSTQCLSVSPELMQSD